MRKAVSFNPHWVNSEPAWDIRLLNGVIHRGVTRSKILKASKSYNQVVTERDIQNYGSHHLTPSNNRG